ncbi:MAG: hypothetical protein GX477_06200 [Clostridiaceae bacterium]|nr:hypothetical protein [Clostridiaceae bacterium]
MYNNSMKNCAFCGESIPSDAVRCPYCASMLETAADDGADRTFDAGGVPGPGPNMMKSGVRAPLSNGLKVFLTLLFAMVPGFGQIAGIITAIVFMSSDDDSDRRSFGTALLVANLALFILACLGCFLLGLLEPIF